MRNGNDIMIGLFINLCVDEMENGEYLEVESLWLLLWQIDGRTHTYTHTPLFELLTDRQAK